MASHLYAVVSPLDSIEELICNDPMQWSTDGITLHLQILKTILAWPMLDLAESTNYLHLQKFCSR